MLTLTTLASGSSGNCTLISAGKTHVLVDVGISARRISLALSALGIPTASVAAICITHEHSDHIAGLATLTKQFHIPVYTSPGTARQLDDRIAGLSPLLHPCTPGESFALSNLHIDTCPTLHDAAEPMGFSFSFGGRKVAVVTDLGSVTPAVRETIAGANLVLLEANHDPEWVRSSHYPVFLQQRILGKRGHLSNEDGGALARLAVEEGANRIILAHLSNENNTPARAQSVVAALLCGGAPCALCVAPRDATGPCFEV